MNFALRKEAGSPPFFDLFKIYLIIKLKTQCAIVNVYVNICVRVYPTTLVMFFYSVSTGSHCSCTSDICPLVVVVSCYWSPALIGLCPVHVTCVLANKNAFLLGE